MCPEHDPVNIIHIAHLSLMLVYSLLEHKLGKTESRSTIGLVLGLLNKMRRKR